MSDWVCCFSRILHKTRMPLPTFCGSTTAMYLSIYPNRSNRFCRSKVGEGERCTRAANSFTVRWESFCRIRNINLSVSSNNSVFIILD